MALRLADCEEELRGALERLKEVDTKLNALSQERAELGTVVQGWQAIVAKKRKDSGEEPPTVAAAPPRPELSEDEEEETSENKTQFVRDQIRANATAGMTAKDLKAAAKAAGLKHPPSWPYGPLQRLKKKGEIFKRKGRFYPKGATNPALVG